MTREQLTVYFAGRTDLSRLQRQEILLKIATASQRSIDTDRACVGKHWFLMGPERETCPYCGWVLA